MFFSRDFEILGLGKGVFVIGIFFFVKLKCDLRYKKFISIILIFFRLRVNDF